MRADERAEKNEGRARLDQQTQTRRQALLAETDTRPNQHHRGYDNQQKKRTQIVQVQASDRFTKVCTGRVKMMPGCSSVAPDNVSFTSAITFSVIS